MAAGRVRVDGAGVAASVIMVVLTPDDLRQGPHPQMSSSPIAVLLPHAPVTSTEPAALPVAVTAAEQPGLLTVLATVPDPRDPRGVRYPLASMLGVAVCAVLAGAVTFAAIADWVRDLDSPAWARLGFTGRIPVASTVWRLLVRVDAEVLTSVLAGWLRARCEAGTPASTSRPVTDRRRRRMIAVDDKVLRGSRLPDGSQVHLLSAYDTGTGKVLAQAQIAAKSNEIPAFTPLLDRGRSPTRQPDRCDRRRGRPARPDWPRPRGRHPRRLPRGHHQGESADVAQSAQSVAVGRGPGR
ncbi:hypothetical protein Vau01_124680 [Virgisporangium aurantiacum]|uniref:H repeat-associated protein N-terminal domain-containing protein n=1 Tax=Virgisporangium aurantiacum TaxID=175570 RepID=A0A8J3ZIY2_9ACTN|nr:hypothetical protein Vau01_124680 [Virgisporangium aurantiacum]